MLASQIRVAIDVGCEHHRVAIGLSDGKVLDEFDIEHCKQGFESFFNHVETIEKRYQLPVAVAMEGYNGYARPLDGQIFRHGYKLYSVNNLKLARFKEIFPTPAKTDAIDARKILELFQLSEHLPLAKDALHEVAAIPEVNEKLKRLSRRRKQLVEERVRVVNRMQNDIQGTCPGLLSITNDATNDWFLNFITSREDFSKLATMRKSSLLDIKGVGKKYAADIQCWQKEAVFSPDVTWVGKIIIQDAKRLISLNRDIKQLDNDIAELLPESVLAQRIGSIPGFGNTTSAELAGEIGNIERFESEASLAMYLGMAALDNSSGKKVSCKTPRQVNKRAKAAMMIAVAHHIWYAPKSRAYYDKKRAEGKKHNQAVRALGRQLVRVIWSMIKHERAYEAR